MTWSTVLISQSGASAIAVTIACAACSSASAGPSTSFSDSDPSLVTSTSDSGQLRVELRTSPQPPARGLINAQFVVTRVADGTPFEGLTLHIQPWMPVMNHGAIAPTITDQGDGKYLIVGVDLFMAGLWQLRTSVSGPMDDHVAPEFNIQ